MIIQNFTTKHYRIPLRAHMTDAMHGVMTHFEVILVKLETSDGVQGIGYTYTIGQGGAAIRSLINEAYKPLLMGENPRNIERLWEKMWWKLHYIGRGGPVSFAISAVDIALWDLIGNKEGIQAICLARVGIDSLESLHQGGIEHVDRLMDLREHWRFFEKAGQMPPIEPSRFQPNPQFFDTLLFCQSMHPFCEGLGPRQAIGASPTWHHLASIR